MLVLATLGAPERRRLARKKRRAEVEPEPTLVATGRVTVVDVGVPFAEEAEAAAWLGKSGEQELAADLAVLNRALHDFRLVSADPYLSPVSRHQALVARIGYGAGEEVADGLWTDARELIVPKRWQRRSKVLAPQARFAALLSGRERALICEELALRARLDLDQGREREAALQVLVALDAAIADLAVDDSPTLQDRLDELRAQRDPIAVAAQSALEGPLSDDERESVAFTLGRIEAALRARAVASA